MDAWYQRGIKLDSSGAGNPSRTRIESFNGKHRDECLNENWFISIDDARTTEAYRVDYNEIRPHTSLDNVWRSVDRGQVTVRRATGIPAPIPNRCAVAAPTPLTGWERARILVAASKTS